MKQLSQTSDDEIESEYIRISKNIRALRIKKNMTQEEVAHSMGFNTPVFYTNAENNSNGKHFNLEHVIKLSRIFAVDINELFAHHD